MTGLYEKVSPKGNQGDIGACEYHSAYLFIKKKEKSNGQD